MEDKRIYEDLSLVHRRANAVFWIIAVLLLFVLGYYWKVQILDYQTYWRLAEANPTRSSILVAPRGLIRDRNGEIIADNKASYKVSLLRERVRTSSRLVPIADFLGIGIEELTARLEKYGNIPIYDPVVIKDNLDFENEVPRIMSRQREFPELQVETEPMRSYPHGTFAAHVLGYLQERDPEEISADPERRYRPGSMGGKSGMERTYDAWLSGRDGTEFEVVDSLGKSRGVYHREPAVEGRDVTLTLDATVQRAAEKILEGREGAVVVMDPATGEILAMASFPTYDPNRFIGRFTPEEWQELVGDPASPLENRAIRGLYSPGSIFKLVMALGGLDFGYVSPWTTHYCSGSADFYGTPRYCWFLPGHGSMNLVDAIRNSCNIYFYHLSREMGIDLIALAADRIGLGRPTGIDLSGEKEGIVPSSGWKMRTQKVPWYPGETISVGIGQGPLLVTPLQVALMTSVLANRGIRPTPRLFLSLGEGEGGPPPEVPEGRENVDFQKSSFETIIEGMWKSVNLGGTGQGAKVEGFDVCGKTGSTQLIGRELAKRLSEAGREVKTHSWFSGFAPRDNPRVVVTVLVEYGGGGGALAAPLAREIFRIFTQDNDRPTAR
jgi:penicillin-binding protein 2